MSRETSPLIVGDYWLDKRRDGLSPDIWQVASYAPKSRSVVYRSTKQRTVNLEAAKAFLRSFEAEQRSTVKCQDASEAELLPHLFHYLREHGPDVKRLDTVKSSFRAWIGFLMQDELGTGCFIADITPNVVTRFRRWRMGPHSWEVPWDDKVYRHKSEGVSGQAVQRNIEDLRSALIHGEAERRFEAPRVPSVKKEMRKKKRQAKLLDAKTLGAVVGYAKQDEDKGPYRELALMLGTCCRPGVALAFDPAEQWHDDVLDLQPEDREETDKRNAIVPVIDPLLPILKDWKEKPHEKVASRKRWWRTARRVLGVGDVRAYDVRHTVATMLDNAGVPGVQLSGIAGHLPSSRNIARTTSQHYLHYDPRNCPQAKRALTRFYKAVMAEADQWNADHLRTKPEYKKPISIVLRAEEMADLQEV
jgi:integrase